MFENLKGTRQSGKGGIRNPFCCYRGGYFLYKWSLTQNNSCIRLQEHKNHVEPSTISLLLRNILFTVYFIYKLYVGFFALFTYTSVLFKICWARFLFWCAFGDFFFLIGIPRMLIWCRHIGVGMLQTLLVMPGNYLIRHVMKEKREKKKVTFLI